MGSLVTYIGAMAQFYHKANLILSSSSEPHRSNASSLKGGTSHVSAGLPPTVIVGLTVTAQTTVTHLSKSKKKRTSAAPSQGRRHVYVTITIQ